MTNPQIPTNWNPLTYAVDEHNKVVWKQGSHAVAMGLTGKKDTLIPGYKIYLCTSEELPAVRHRIAVQQEQRDEEPFTPEEEEELGRMFADGWMRRSKPVKEEPKKKTQPIQWGQWIQLLALPLLFFYFVFNPSPPDPRCTDLDGTIYCEPRY